ncbi:hypothetical protein EO98_05610 [Methanosarcina sp. 2.H.T.1A.6]|uniref:hypothetical protein n=1 Tax=unclassified Methanosarcina TaxID=2644672 RepID=UPI00062227FD|nr:MULTISPECIES: hypothetical protein [unclassified Methanosarcina]KKG13664.1 hypothetical protein EO94_11345 [Methanosarcina sp. 2.H.T.1A.3]KKG24866.1 hypothetical protein EO98_05610 [Methanosarcina sp. 2.H.T.1A.6]KKG26015.1 hypothetical protein EO96_15990 [Methanosarcina sp. 2.H.T.1A.8]KKG27826.1 hypothetical protein EO97_02160 [Methanosarcina sp. 2.H.T.1A.15]
MAKLARTIRDKILIDEPVKEHVILFLEGTGLPFKGASRKEKYISRKPLREEGSVIFLCNLLLNLPLLSKAKLLR